MRDIIFTILILVIKLPVFAQVPIGLRGITLEAINNKLPQNTEVILRSVEKDELGTIQANLVTDDNRFFKVRYGLLDRIAFGDANNLDEIWKARAIKSGMYKQLAAKGWQMGIRKRLEDASNQLVTFSQPLVYDNGFLEEYLYAHLVDFIPASSPCGLTTNIKITLMMDDQPECILLPNGSLIVNSGLLALVENQDELRAILVQQLVHYLLDHYMVNFNKQLAEESFNELLGLTAWFAGVGSEVLIASKRNVTLGGQISSSVAMLAGLLMDSVKYDLGTHYTLKQVLEADAICRDLLAYRNIPVSGLDRVLARVKNYYASAQNKKKVEELNQRIQNPFSGGIPGPDVDVIFCKLVSGIYTANARAQFVSGRYKNCLEMVDKKIRLGMAVEDDYLIKAACLSRQHHGNLQLQESYQLIVKAEKLDIAPPQDLYYRKGLALMHLNRFAEAEVALARYLQIMMGSGADLEETRQIKQLIFQCKQMK